MNLEKILIYDCEIIRCIPHPSEDDKPGLEYCGSWNDHANMGISVIATYSENLIAPGSVGFNTFINHSGDIPLDPLLAEAIQRWFDLADLVIGFNSVQFDDRLMAANGIQVKTGYDLLQKIRIASGQPPNYVRGKTRWGYNLNAIAEANGFGSKTGSGDLAPVLWQRGQKDAVVKYCEHDVLLTRQIWENRHQISDPTNGELLDLG